MTTPSDEIVEAAEGTIDKELLTETGEGGILSNGYLHTQPLIEYLEDDETLAYLFDNLKKGIEPHRDREEQTVTPDSNYRAMVAITSKRILFVIGQADGDEVIEVPFSSVVTATAHSGFRTDRIEIETTDGTIDFYLRSDPEMIDAVDYINQRLSESTAAQDTGSMPSDQSSQDDGDSLAVAYIDQTAVSEDSLNLVQEAETLIQDVGTDIEDIDGAREQLTRAHNKLCRVLSAEDSGVNKDEVDQRVVDVEKRLDALGKAAQILSNARALDLDGEDEITRKSRLYRRAISAAEQAGLSLPEVETALADLQSTQSIPEIDSEDDSGTTETEPTDTTASDQSESNDSTDEPPSRRDELLIELEEVADNLGRVPSYSDMYEYDGVNPVEYTETFGSWKQALDESSIDVRARLIAALEELGEELNRMPMRTEINEHGRYDARWYDDYFDSLDDTFSQISVEHPSREELLDELRSLKKKLGFVPAKHHVEKYGNYSSKLYRKEFDSVKQATAEVGLDYKEDVIEALRDVAKEVKKRPTTTDFEKLGRYSSSYVYDPFETWGDACNAAGVASDAAVAELLGESTTSKTATSQQSASSGPDSTTEVEPSPLAEYYEVFGHLENVQTALLGDYLEDHVGQMEPMARWHTLVRNRWAGDAPSSSVVAESYGTQQHDRTDFAISDYRDTYGDGDHVTEFQAIEIAPLQASVKELLSIVAGMDDSEAAQIRLPKAPDSDVPLPVIVESEAEYERAKGLLEEFPDRPTITVDSDGQDQEPQQVPGSETPVEDDQPAASSASDDDLTKIGGITPSIAAALRNAGYESKDDLREADTEALTAVDGVDSQKANRIKLVVGG